MRLLCNSETTPTMIMESCTIRYFMQFISRHIDITIDRGSPNTYMRTIITLLPTSMLLPYFKDVNQLSLSTFPLLLCLPNIMTSRCIKQFLWILCNTTHSLLTKELIIAHVYIVQSKRKALTTTGQRYRCSSPARRKNKQRISYE